MTQIDELLIRLSSADLAGAEGALARLAIEGARAIEPLLAAFPGAPDSARARMLRLLERVPDVRVMPLLKSTAADGPDDLRRLAVRALGAQPAHRSRAALMETLPGEHDIDVRAEIVALLARLAGGETPEI
ncbi:MAG: HEAT repeat domain-containing protein, partial [Acidobacteria bacterium]|nr:HEAT repeat domain-containing protein [Acidobacteriota bacterium]